MAKRKPAPTQDEDLAPATGGDDDVTSTRAAWEAAKPKTTTKKSPAAKKPAAEPEAEAEPEKPADDETLATEDLVDDHADDDLPLDPEDRTAATGETAADLRERLRSRGYDVDAFDDDDALLDAFDATFKESQDVGERFRKVEPQLAEYLANASEFQKWRASQNAGDPSGGGGRGAASVETDGAAAVASSAEASPPEKPEKPKWQAPAVSELAESLLDSGVITFDAKTRTYTSEDQRFSKEAREVTEYMRWANTVRRRQTDDPAGLVLEAGLRDEFERRDSEIEALKKELAEIKGGYQKDKVVDQIEQFFKQHSAEFFIGDDPDKLTPRGEAYAVKYDQLQKRFPGATDQELHEEAKEFAYAKHPPETNGKPTNGKTPAAKGGDGASAAPATEQRATKQRTFLQKAADKGAARQTGRDASVRRRAARGEVDDEPRRLDDLWRSSVRAVESEAV